MRVVALSCLLLAVVACLVGCDGGVVDAGGECASQVLPAAAFARLNDHVSFDDGGWHVSQDGTATVLPSGRLLTPMGTTVPSLGYPIRVVTHPTLHVAYVADMGASAYGNRCNLDPSAPKRGIHVVNVDTGQELQTPETVPLLTLDASAPSMSTGCKVVEPSGDDGDDDLDGGDGGPKPGSIAPLPHDASYGLAIDAAGKRLYAATGTSGYVYVFDIGADGSLSPNDAIYLSGYTAGLALSHDETHLWVVQFVGASNASSGLIAIDLRDGGVGASIGLANGSGAIEGAYDVASASTPAGERVYVTGFRNGPVIVYDPDDGGMSTVPGVGKNPEAVIASPSGDRVFVTSSDDDDVYVITTADGGVSPPLSIGAGGFSFDDAGLPGSSPTALAFDAEHELLYVARATDNAVSVVDTSGAVLAEVGAVPVGFYPTSLSLFASGPLVVANGKGAAQYLGDASDVTYGTFCGGTGYADIEMPGSLSILPLPLDLDAGTRAVERNIKAPSALDSFDCPSGRYPVPPPGSAAESPIKHIVLIVRENKTFDFLLGGVGGLQGGENQIDTMRGAIDGCETDTPACRRPLTRNIRNIASQFALNDNFFAASEVSSQGHAWLTASFVNDYVERAHLEEGSDSLRDFFQFGDENGVPAGTPGFGSFFTHLIKYAVPFEIFGEAVGITGHYGDDYVINHIDLTYPLFDLSRSDDDRADIAITSILDGDNFPSFVYLELPRDHTMGLTPGYATPEVMIADNDAATGKLVSAFSHSAAWPETAIFIVEDDPQMGYDHIDYHRVICVVASPWVQPGTVSHVNASFPSLFRTFELILGIPPMNRFDAYAMPLRDMFSAAPSSNAYEYYPSPYSLTETNSACSVGSFVSSQMDFKEPDTSPLLGDVVMKHLTGTYPRGSPLVGYTGAGPIPRLHWDDDGR